MKKITCGEQTCLERSRKSRTNPPLMITMMLLSISPAIALCPDNSAAQPVVSKPVLSVVERVEPQLSSTVMMNPALIGLKAIRIGVFSQFPQPDTALADLNTRAGKRLAESDPRLAALLKNGINAGPAASPPLLRINIDRFILTPDRPPVFRVQTTLSADILVGINPTIILNIDLWSRIETIQAPNTNSEFAAVSNLVNKHIEQFAADFSLANAPPSLPADVNNITTPPAASRAKPQTPKKTEPEKQEKTQTNQTDTQAQFSFVGSKSSVVFHKPDCTSVKSILPKNLVYYKTRDEAIAAGKRPCLKCKP
jgi:hypothetical protein